MDDELIKKMWVESWLEQDTGVEPDEEEIKALKSFLAKARPIIERQLLERILSVADLEGGHHTFKGKSVEDCIFIKKSDWQKALKGGS